MTEHTPLLTDELLERIRSRAAGYDAENAFFLDDYDAYGEVPVPGSASLHLPAGEVTISLHTVIIGGPNGGGLPVPPLGVTIDPPSGVAQPAVTENFGSTTTVNNDAHVRVWVTQIPSEGNYNITTDGKATVTSTHGWPSATAVRLDFWYGCSSACSSSALSGRSWPRSGWVVFAETRRRPRVRERSATSSPLPHYRRSRSRR